MEKKPHGFCETPEENCTMNYCDDNGCQNRKRELVNPDPSSELAELNDKYQEVKAENERLKQKISASNKLIEENKKSFKSELYNLRRALKRKDFAPINPELIQSKAENERLINKIHQLRLKINSLLCRKTYGK